MQTRHGRRLATIDKILAIVNPNSDATFERLHRWTNNRGVDLVAVDVGDDIGDVYEKSKAALSVTLKGDGTFLEDIKTVARGIPLVGLNAVGRRSWCF